MRLAAFITGSDSAGLHVIDERWQRRIAGHGVPLVDHPRSDSFCRLVVEYEEEINVADAVSDGRFDYSSATKGDDPIRFYAAVPLRVGGGEVIGAVCTFDTNRIELPEDRMRMLEDIALQATTCIEMATLIDELGAAATSDELTGVANRLILADRLAYQLARMRRRGGDDLAVALLDLDDFKQINDRLGHQAGDEVLRVTAARISETLRADDTVARIGGDEFVLIAQGDGTRIEIDRLEERLQEAIASEVVLDDATVTPEASIGIVRAESDDTPETLLARADETMYARKAERKAAAGRPA